MTAKKNGSDKTGRSFVDVLLKLLAQIPNSEEPCSDNPGERARSIVNAAAIKAAVVSGTLSLPPGPAGWVTILPDLTAVWKIQAQMVADIAACFGKRASLTREDMLYCYFVTLPHKRSVISLPA